MNGVVIFGLWLTSAPVHAYTCTAQELQTFGREECCWMGDYSQCQVGDTCDPRIGQCSGTPDSFISYREPTWQCAYNPSCKIVGVNPYQATCDWDYVYQDCYSVDYCCDGTGGSARVCWRGCGASGCYNGGHYKQCCVGGTDGVCGITAPYTPSCSTGTVTNATFCSGVLPTNTPAPGQPTATPGVANCNATYGGWCANPSSCVAPYSSATGTECDANGGGQICCYGSNDACPYSCESTCPADWTHYSAGDSECTPKICCQPPDQVPAVCYGTCLNANYGDDCFDYGRYNCSTAHGGCRDGNFSLACTECANKPQFNEYALCCGSLLPTSTPTITPTPTITATPTPDSVAPQCVVMTATPACLTNPSGAVAVEANYSDNQNLAQYSITCYTGSTWPVLATGNISGLSASANFSGALNADCQTRLTTSGSTFIAAAAIDAAGNQSYGEGYNFNCSQNIYYLANPTNVQASDGIYCDRVYITWNAVPGATSYKVYRGLNIWGEINYTYLTTLAGNGSTTYSDIYSETTNNFDISYNYQYKITALSGHCAETTGLVNQGNIKLSSISNMSCSNNQQYSIDLSWTNSGDNCCSRIDFKNAYFWVTPTPLPGNATSHTADNLENNTFYDFVASCVHMADNTSRAINVSCRTLVPSDCNGDYNKWCSNAGAELTVKTAPSASVPSWQACESWCQTNMTMADPICQYNGPGGCWTKSMPAGGCTWVVGSPNPKGSWYYCAHETPSPTPTTTPTPTPTTTPTVTPFATPTPTPTTTPTPTPVVGCECQINPSTGTITEGETQEFSQTNTCTGYGITYFAWQTPALGSYTSPPANDQIDVVWQSGGVVSNTNITIVGKVKRQSDNTDITDCSATITVNDRPALSCDLFCGGIGFPCPAQVESAQNINLSTRINNTINTAFDSNWLNKPASATGIYDFDPFYSGPINPYDLYFGSWTVPVGESSFNFTQEIVEILSDEQISLGLNIRTAQCSWLPTVPAATNTPTPTDIPVATATPTPTITPTPTDALVATATPTPVPQFSNIGGYVWFDKNADGIQNCTRTINCQCQQAVNDYKDTCMGHETDPAQAECCWPNTYASDSYRWVTTAAGKTCTGGHVSYGGWYEIQSFLIGQYQVFLGDSGTKSTTYTITKGAAGLPAWVVPPGWGRADFGVIAQELLPSATPTPVLTTTPTPTATPTLTPTLTPTPTPLPLIPWWQVRGGHAYARGSIRSILTGLPSTINFIHKDRFETTDSAGAPMCSLGPIEVDGRFTDRSEQYNVVGQPDYVCTTYSLSSFMRQLAVPADATWHTNTNPIADLNTYLASPTVKTISSQNGNIDIYLHQGDLNLSPSSSWSISDSLMIMVNGNVNIEQSGSDENLITLNGNQFFGLIASGDVTFTNSVGYSDQTTTPNAINNYANWDGLVFTDGKIISESTNDPNSEKKLILSGSYLGCGGVELHRQLTDVNDDTHPAELFIYNAQLAADTPPELKESQIIWQESL